MKKMTPEDIEQCSKLLTEILEAMKRGEATDFEMRAYLSENRVVNDFMFNVGSPRNIRLYLKTTD